MVKVNFVGDITPGGVLTYMGGVSEDVKRLLADADLRVGTLETAFGDGTKMCHLKMADPKRGNIIYAPDEMVRLIKDLHIDIVSLANNHISDLDVEGIYHTIEVLDKNDICHLGAGRNIEEASRPLIKTINGKKLCFLAYCDHMMPCVYCATETEPGMTPLIESNVISDIIQCKTKYDYVFVIPHWGKENTHWPQLKFMNMCRQFVQAGADGIIGSHTHFIQPTYTSRGAVVSPSLGNFLFPDRYIDTPRITVYPTTEQRSDSNIPTVNNYPIVKQLTFKRVKTAARIGEVLTLEIGKRITYKRQLTMLNEANVLGLHNDAKLESKLNRIARIIKYEFAYKAKLRTASLLHKLHLR